VFAGDDVTDEAGFETINQQGGVSIRIGDSRPTAAAYGCPNVAAMQTWLLELLGAEAS
jgi:trehalose 6-phosphate phosphatase